MNEEQIIRNEAKGFFNDNLGDNSENINAIDDFHKLKSRLFDFYTSEKKALFLDEIESLINKDLKEHKDLMHRGTNKTCQIDIKAEKLLFYIKQEIDTLPIIAHQKFNSNNKIERTKVFISYSHLDKDILIDVQRHFKPFLKKIDFWDDSKIDPGQKWKEEIRKAINETRVAILLISTDFLGSDFIATNELPALLSAAEQEGVVILNVILKPCLFEEFKDLNQYQTMNPPDRPLTKMDYNEKEELFVNIVRQTKKFLK